MVTAELSRDEVVWSLLSGDGCMTYIKQRSEQRRGEENIGKEEKEEDSLKMGFCVFIFGICQTTEDMSKKEE